MWYLRNLAKLCDQSTFEILLVKFPKLVNFKIVKLPVTKTLIDTTRIIIRNIIRNFKEKAKTRNAREMTTWIEY